MVPSPRKSLDSYLNTRKRVQFRIKKATGLLIVPAPMLDHVTSAARDAARLPLDSALRSPIPSSVRADIMTTAHANVAAMGLLDFAANKEALIEEQAALTTAARVKARVAYINTFNEAVDYELKKTLTNLVRPPPNPD